MRKRYALCVGINDYPGSGADLRGCVNDMQDWAAALRGRGYEVEMIADAAATKSALLDALRRLVGRAGLGDRIVFTYSGHGTWVPDRDGDEIDKRDEALVCHDYRTGGLITDDELYAVFSARKHGVRATILSDSCHSGTMMRFAPSLDGEPDDVDREPRFLSPGVLPTVDVTVEQAAEAERVAPASKSRPGTVLVSGCLDHEVSYDAYIDGRYRGAMTSAALRVLDRSKTVKGFAADLRRELPSSKFPQTPQVAASRSQARLPLL